VLVFSRPRYFSTSQAEGVPKTTSVIKILGMESCTLVGHQLSATKDQSLVMCPTQGDYMLGSHPMSLTWVFRVFSKVTDGIVISGWVAMDTYIRDPTALRYGIFLIQVFSFSETMSVTLTVQHSWPGHLTFQNHL